MHDLLPRYRLPRACPSLGRRSLVWRSIRQRRRKINCVGTRALYTSLDPATCMLDMVHGLIGPRTVVSYDVDCECMGDLRTARGWKSAGVELGEMNCPWQSLAHEKKLPGRWQTVSSGLGTTEYSLRALRSRLPSQTSTWSSGCTVTACHT